MLNSWRLCVAVALATICGSVTVPIGQNGRAAGLQAVSARGESVQTTVPAGADLQGYINRARPGDVLLLEPGATYVGNFVLPALPEQPANVAAQFITIRSAADDSHFPAGGRVGPEHILCMPNVRSPNGESALSTKPGAHHWRLQWLAFQANTEGAGNIISLGDGGDGQRDLATVPHHLQLDGLILRGDPSKGQKRGIGLNSAETTIRNSDIRDIKADGQDSQAICGWNGPGPFVIDNNYLEAAGENVMFGGADPPIRDLVPSDITIRRNFVTKSLDWRNSPWTVKNLLELKNARRVLIEANIFENNWVAAQTGYALLFKPTNQDGHAPWVEVTDVTFQYNIVRHSSSAVSINGTDYQYPSGVLRRLQIRNNLFFDIDAGRWGGEGRFLKVGDGPVDIIVDHNTAIQSGSVLQLYGTNPDGRPHVIDNFHLTNNLTLHNEYGILGDAAGFGNSAIAAYLSHEEVRRNVLAGGDPSRYPGDNLFPSVSELMSQFVDSSQNNYRLRETSKYRSAATDGSPLGANMDELSRRTPPERQPRVPPRSK
jgi:hypothetical protein